jgi:hypothetical protein
MNEIDLLRQRVTALERRLRWTGLLIIIIILAAGVVGAMNMQNEILHVRGIVVTDASGRERIILGAPMGEASKNERLGETTGLAVLDTLGRLHVSVGTNNPLVLADGRKGRRVSTSVGLTIYDPRDGKERGGIGAFADGRANICLDYGNATKEAACIAVAPDDQYAAVILNGTPREKDYDRVTMFVGADGGGSMKVMGGNENRGGVMIRAGNGPPRITVYDTTGVVSKDLLR